MDLLKNTYFINLEARVDRLQHVSKELDKVGINANRFNAIKTADGAVGCTISHIKLIEMAREKNLSEIFICEDDITFLNVALFKDKLKKFNENIKDWDVLIIGGNVVKPYKLIDDYCLRTVNCQTTTGYIVKNHYYTKLIDNFKEGLRKLLNDLNNRREYAIDIYWKTLQKEDKWYLLYPLTVTQYENYSDIEMKNTNYNHLMLDPEKKWLYRKH